LTVLRQENYRSELSVKGRTLVDYSMTFDAAS